MRETKPGHEWVSNQVTFKETSMRAGVRGSLSSAINGADARIVIDYEHRLVRVFPRHRGRMVEDVELPFEACQRWNMPTLQPIPDGKSAKPKAPESTPAEPPGNERSQPRPEPRRAQAKPIARSEGRGLPKKRRKKPRASAVIG